MKENYFDDDVFEKKCKEISEDNFEQIKSIWNDKEIKKSRKRKSVNSKTNSLIQKQILTPEQKQSKQKYMAEYQINNKEKISERKKLKYQNRTEEQKEAAKKKERERYKAKKALIANKP